MLLRMWIIAVLGIRDTRILGAHEQASQSETELQAQREQNGKSKERHAGVTLGLPMHLHRQAEQGEEV